MTTPRKSQFWTGVTIKTDSNHKNLIIQHISAIKPVVFVSRPPGALVGVRRPQDPGPPAGRAAGGGAAGLGLGRLQRGRAGMEFSGDLWEGLQGLLNVPF